MGFIGKTFALTLDSSKQLVPLSHLQNRDQNATWRYRQVIRWYLAALQQTQRLSQSEMLSLQTYRLNKVVRAAARTPWWQKRFSDAGINPATSVPFDALKALPPTQKRDLVSVRPEDLCLNARSQSLLWRTTTGTDGRPISWAQDIRSHFIEYAAYYLRSLEHFGVPVWKNLDGKFFLMFNYPNVKDYYLAFFAKGIYAPYPKAGNPPSLQERRAAYNALQTTHPAVLYGAPSALWYLAQLAEADGCELRPDTMVFSGEMLNDDIRAYIEKTFNADIRGLYGTRELGTVGFSCGKRNNVLHLNSEHILLEVLDDGGNPCAAREYGNLTMTSLTNLSIPLLRYQPGDVGRIVEGGCDCNTKLPLFELQGRESEFLLLPRNKKIPIWPLYEALFADERFDKIRQYQIRQTAEDRIDIAIVKKEAWLCGDSLNLIRTIKKEIGEWMLVEIKFVDSIESAGRKFRTFIPIGNLQK